MLTETTGTRIAATIANEIRDQLAVLAVAPDRARFRLHDGDLPALITQTIARVVDAEVNELLDVLERVIATRARPYLDEFDGDPAELARAVKAHADAVLLLHAHGR